MTAQNFRRRLTLGLLFLVLSIVFYIFSSEDLLYYVVLSDLPAVQNWKILSLHLLADVSLATSKIAIGYMLLIGYGYLKDKNIPLVGFIWIFAVFYLLAGAIFVMNLISFYRVYIWIDGIIRACAGIFGVAAAISLYKSLPFIKSLRSPVEYGQLAQEIHELKIENDKLQKILSNKDEELRKTKK